MGQIEYDLYRLVLIYRRTIINMDTTIQRIERNYLELHLTRCRHRKTTIDIGLPWSMSHHHGVVTVIRQYRRVPIYHRTRRKRFKSIPMANYSMFSRISLMVVYHLHYVPISEEDKQRNWIIRFSFLFIYMLLSRIE
jgi:hypothetical protein